MKPRLGLGLIGTGFMGRAHAIGFATAARVFDLPFSVDLVAVADVDAADAERARQLFGFRRATTDWRSLVHATDIDVIDITTPNHLHHDMAVAAIEAGKHVYCEKPLACNAADTLAMTHAAETAGVATQVGFNYLKNPLFDLARSLIADGELGDILSYRGVHVEDYMADPDQPMTWRNEPASGGGVAGDLGSHAFATARFLLGPVESLHGRCRTLIPTRPVAGGEPDCAAVLTEDHASAHVSFENGVIGTLEVNWAATGRKMQHDFEVYGTRGSLCFSQERLNELKLYRAGDGATRGFATVLAGPDHPPYDAFCIAPGHQLGFNDLKTIEVRDFLDAVAGRPARGPDFREGHEVQRLVDALLQSSRENRTVCLR